MYRILNSPLLCSPSLALRRSLSSLSIIAPSQPARQLTWISNQYRRPILSLGNSQVTLLVQCRNMGGPKTVAKLFQKDRIDSTNFEMIYRSDLTTYFVWCQWAMLATAAVFIFMAVSETLIFFFPQLTPKPPDNDSEKRSFGGFSSKMDELVGIRKALNVQNNDMAYDWLDFDKYLEEVGPNRHLAITGAVLVLIAAVSKLMRMVPVRIYSSITNPDKCLAARFSYFIPGRTVTQKFQAGTLEPFYKKKLLPIANNIYKDSTGAPYLIYSRFFRSTSEFYRLLSEEARTIPMTLDTKDERPGEVSRANEKINWKQLRAQAQQARQRQAKGQK